LQLAGGAAAAGAASQSAKYGEIQTEVSAHGKGESTHALDLPAI